MEDALYGINSMRHFTGLKLDRLPDKTTIIKLRHCLEQQRIENAMSKEMNKYLTRWDCRCYPAPPRTKRRIATA